jgi:GTPase SAR1 family protein
MSNFIVAIVGLPSVGKSSIINSLVFKRLLQTGVCRTTTEFTEIDIDIFDDNNNKFRVFDLPGMCDSEEKNTNFNDLTYAHITNSNLIIWTSDVSKAFITTHEVNEYNKLKNYIKQIEDNSGTLYHVIIMLSKCDKDINNKKTKKKKSMKNTEEIEDSDEDTDINDLILKVKEKFPNEDIILYNAYGRSYYNKNTSSTLKSFVRKMIGDPTKNNITFDISKYIKTYQEDQQKAYYNKFIKIYDNFINFKINKENFISYWNKITKKEQLNHLLEICNNPFVKNYNIFNYINIVCDNFIKDHYIIRYQLINYYINIIIDNKYKECENTFKLYTVDELIELFIEHYTHLSEYMKLELYRLLLFTNLIPNNMPSVVKIINKIYLYGYDKSILSFYNNFNDYIMKYNKEEFIIFYSKMRMLLNINKEYNPNIDNKFDCYINKLKKLNNDEDYILYNKLEILSCLFHNIPITSIFHNFSKYEIGIPYDRLKYNNKYIEAINEIWNNIYSNKKINFNHNNYNDFIPIDKTELLYVLEYVDID